MPTLYIFSEHYFYSALTRIVIIRGQTEGITIRRLDVADKPFQVKRYRNEKEYQKDAGKMLGNGYEVQSVVSEQPRSGCGRFVALGGIGAIIFKPKPELVVTYRLALPVS